MNRQQKNYTIDRINNEVRKKHIECSCKRPSLEEHIKRAICSGQAKLLPTAKINESAEKAVIDGTYRPSLALESVFAPPKSYREANSEFESEQKRIEARNNALDGKAQKIIDQVNLDKYDDGEDAIADAIKLVA
ncbi:MAG: hypothetical protein AAFX93_19770 [Verrucomicrobiota bacterium]